MADNNGLAVGYLIPLLVRAVEALERIAHAQEAMAFSEEQEEGEASHVDPHRGL